MLKKWIALLLAAVLLLSLSGCGQEEEAPLEDESLSEQIEPPEEEPVKEEPEAEEPVEEDVVTGELELAPPEPEEPEFRIRSPWRSLYRRGDDTPPYQHHDQQHDHRPAAGTDQSLPRGSHS